MVALENLQSIFSQGAGIGGQIGGRHGGLTNESPSQPPHPDEHSSLDNLVGMAPTPNKPTPDTNLFGPTSDKPTPDLNVFGPTGNKPTPELGTNPDTPLDSFPTPNLNIPNLPSLGNSAHTDHSTGKHVGWHSELDLNKGGTKPSSLENMVTQTSTFTNEQLAGISGLKKESMYFSLADPETYKDIDLQNNVEIMFFDRDGIRNKKRKVENMLDELEPTARELKDLNDYLVSELNSIFPADNRKKVYLDMKKELRKDRAKVAVSEISEFGVLEMTRERTGLSIVDSLTESCEDCRGIGRILSKDTLLTQIDYWLRDYKQKNKDLRLKLFLHPEIAHYLKKEQKNHIFVLCGKILCI